jgi:ABC-type glycerol-3-phosphate transport system substrate-binding protein
MGRSGAVLLALVLVVAACGGSDDSQTKTSSGKTLEHVNYLLAYLPDMIADHYLLAQDNGDFETCGIDFEY